MRQTGSDRRSNLPPVNDAATRPVLHTVGVGLRRGIIDGRTRRQALGSLAELETDLRRVRADGAPDDATVARTSVASTCLAEVMWVGPAQQAPQPPATATERVAPEWLLTALADGLGTHDCPACNRGGPTVGVLPDGRTCPLCAGWGSL